MKRNWPLVGLLAVVACSQAPTSPAETTGLTPQQLGTAAFDYVVDLTVDRKLGAIYVVGYTSGSLDGPKQGEDDVFLRRYDRDGTVVWKRQFGDSPDRYDDPRALAVDRSGHLYVSYNDKLRKLRADGTPVWTRAVQPQEGTEGTIDARDVTTDPSGNVYVAGRVGYDVFLNKYTSSGSRVWAWSNDGLGFGYSSRGVATDAQGNVYLAASELAYGYAFTDLIKFSPSGKLLFTQTVDDGEKDLNAAELEINGNALYLTGRLYTNWDREGDPTLPFDEDAFVAKFSLNGAEQWRKVFGASQYDGASGVSVDANGGVYVTGYTEGNLGGVYKGGSDIFLRKFTASGNPLWIKQIGSAGNDSGSAVEAYSANELYLAGQAGGALLGGTHRGGLDGFLRRTDGSGNRVWTDQ